MGYCNQSNPDFMIRKAFDRPYGVCMISLFPIIALVYWFVVQLSATTLNKHADLIFHRES